MKKSLFAIVVSIMFFSLSFAAGAGEWKAVYVRGWADNETGMSGGAIFVRDEGGVEHRLTKDGVRSGTPFWLPDGRILFTGRRPDREGTIHIMDEDGGNLVTLPYEGFGAVMSENYLAFETETGDVKVVDLRTKGIATFPLARGPAISPDETMIAFDSGAGVIAISDIERDTRREAARITVGDQPWFYDNDHIVFTGYNEENGGYYVSVVDLRTRGINELTLGGFPSITGEWIVFTGPPGGVQAMKLDGSERHTLPGIEAGAHVLGDLSLPGEAEEPRAVQPMGKLPTVWATLKK